METKLTYPTEWCCQKRYSSEKLIHGENIEYRMASGVLCVYDGRHKLVKSRYEECPWCGKTEGFVLRHSVC